MNGHGVETHCARMIRVHIIRYENFKCVKINTRESECGIFKMPQRRRFENVKLKKKEKFKKNWIEILSLSWKRIYINGVVKPTT